MTTDQKIQKLHDFFEEKKAEASRKFGKESYFELSLYTLKIDSLLGQKRHGACNRNLQELLISKFSLENFHLSDLKLILIHEMAHVISPPIRSRSGRRMVHHKKWRETDIALGGLGKTSVAFEPENIQSKYKWKIVHRDTGEFYFAFEDKPKKFNPKTAYVPSHKRHTLGNLVLVPV